MRFPLRIAQATLAVCLTATFAAGALTQTVKRANPAPNPPAAAPVKPAVSAYQSQGFAPGFDDLMTMLVQPRHIKLYYAGSAKNWELAAAESRDLRSSFDRIVKAIPNYEGNDVALSIRDFIVSRIDAVDSAIAGGDSEKFSAAYQELTAGCNECHTYMEHPFLVIKKPGGTGADSAHSDQDFNPRP